MARVQLSKILSWRVLDFPSHKPSLVREISSPQPRYIGIGSGESSSEVKAVVFLPTPSTFLQNQEFTFRLHEHQDYGWQPRLQARDLMSLLSNLTAIKIRATYVPEGSGFLDDIKLHAARRGAAGQPAQWIEMCTCPTGYIGQFCESCAPGYRHEPTHGGPFARCVPCNCNGHADICDADTGENTVLLMRYLHDDILQQLN